MRDLCPVCRQSAHGTAANNIFRHRDKAGRLCPASGQPMHITYQEGNQW